MTIKSPKVTIAIPVYNGAEYLRIAIESAVSQTYNNTEIIVLDDGSDDGGHTRAVALSFGEKVKYLYQDNSGVAGAMNHILQVMEGDFFTWLSHDDIHRREKVSLQVEYYKALNNKNAIIYSDAFYIDSQGDKIDESRLNFAKYLAHPKRALLDSAINGCTLFIPVHIMRQYGPFDTSLRYVQDYALWNKILHKHDFFLLPCPLISYRIHAGQGTRHPEATVEGDNLWIDIVCQRTIVERAQLAGSSHLYFDSLAKFLTSTPYKHAATTVKQLASKACDDTLVSIILVANKNIHDCLMSAARTLNQTHQKLELLLAAPKTLGDDLAVQLWAASDERIKIITFENDDTITILKRCMMYSKGEYVAFADEKSLFLDHKLEVQLRAMQQMGWLMTTSRSARLLSRVLAEDKVDRKAIPLNHSKCLTVVQRLSSLMIHRSVVCSGKIYDFLKTYHFEDGSFQTQQPLELPAIDDCLMLALS